jgi:hypothetical protein
MNSTGNNRLPQLPLSPVEIPGFLKKPFVENCMAVLLCGLLAATLLYLKVSGENDLKNGPVVEGLIVSCRPVAYDGICLADVEFKTNYGWARRVSIKLQKQENCVVGHKIKVRCSEGSGLVSIIE